MQDLWRLSATDFAALIKSKKVSAKEAATAALARLDAVNPKLNAVVDHRPAEVLAEAAVVDAKIGRGEDPGVLAGVPVTVKVKSGTTDGTMLRVKGKGAPKLKGSGRGDVLARVKIQVPKKLSKKQRELLEELKQAGA